jgi:hypothetical protein
MVLTQPVSSERVRFELGTTNLFGWLLAARTQPLIHKRCGFGCVPGGSSRHVRHSAECLARPLEFARVQHYFLQAHRQCARHLSIG